MVAGSHIVYDGVEYTLSADAISSGTITLSGSPGTLANKLWAARNFGFLIRKTSAGGTVSIDRAIFQYDQSANNLLNGGSGASKQCTEKRYPQGWRISNATNSSPIVLTVIGPDVTTEVSVNDQVTVANVPGNTAANGTWTVSARTANTITLQATAGNAAWSGSYFFGGGLTWKAGAPTGHLCQVLDANGVPAMMWVNPDIPEIHFLGMNWIQDNGSGFNP